MACQKQKVFNNIDTPERAIVAKLKYRLAMRIKGDFYRMRRTKFQDLWLEKTIKVSIENNRAIIAKF